MNKRKIAGCILASIQFVVSVLFIFFAVSTKVIPMKYVLIAGIILGVLPILIVLMQIRKASGIIGICLSVIVIAGLGCGIYMVRHTDKKLDEMTGKTTEITVVNVYVKKDDPAASINDAVTNNYAFGILKEGERDKVNEAIAEIEKDLNTTIDTREYGSIFDIAKALDDGEIKATIVNSGFMSALDGSEEYPDYSQGLRIILEKQIETEVTVDPEKEREKATEKPKEAGCFVAYISGIDTEGPVSVKARSDVNILAVVNRNTRQLLLLSTPRDYWVPLTVSGDQRDKLTHAGIYGIEASMGTLEMLYNVSVDYYLRLNFTGFVNIIDALGGVDVDSQYDFSTAMWPNTYSYHKGINHLGGAAALAFARERYSFRDGDFQRGRNQMAVIKAVISALESSQLLKNYTAVLDELANSFETNMTKEEIGVLVQEQLETDKSWTVLTYSATGTAAMRPCYSSGGGERSVVLENEASVEYANSLIDKVLSGTVMTQDEVTSNAP